MTTPTRLSPEELEDAQKYAENIGSKDMLSLLSHIAALEEEAERYKEALTKLKKAKYFSKAVISDIADDALAPKEWVTS